MCNILIPKKVRKKSLLAKKNGKKENKKQKNKGMPEKECIYLFTFFENIEKYLTVSVEKYIFVTVCNETKEKWWINIIIAK